MKLDVTDGQSIESQRDSHPLHPFKSVANYGTFLGMPVYYKLISILLTWYSGLGISY